MKLVIILLFLSTSASAKHYYFRADSWQPGLHLLAGGGVNAGYYQPTFDHKSTGAGLNLLTDVGYFFSNRFALEVGNNVKFNYVRNYWVWDTLFTAGVRYRFDHFPFTESKSVYLRVFAGNAPTVFYRHDGPSVSRTRRVSRYQFDGPVYGAALGKMFDTKSGNVLFLEYGLTYQRLGRGTGVDGTGLAPEVIFENNSQVTIYSLYASIGLLVF